MNEVTLTAGTIEYTDSGGDGPVVVLIPGLAMDGSLWARVVEELRARHRCVVPTLPLGGHTRPMRPDADLSPRGIARLEVELLDALDLRDVTIVGNDSGAFQFAVVERPERIARLMITSCEAFDNFPPGLPGAVLWYAARVPGGIGLLAQQLRLRPLRRLPVAFGRMTRRPIPPELTDAWLAPLVRHREIRRDLVRYLRAAKRTDMLEAAEGLRSFTRPTLVAWAAQDRVMPPGHGRRFAELLPNARLEYIEDSSTLIPLDQPVRLAALIGEFVASGRS